MKKLIWSLLLSVLAFTTVQAKDLSIGVVSVQAIFKNAPQAAAINAKLQKLLEESKQQLQTMGKEIQASQEKLKKDEMILSKAQKEQAQKKYVASLKKFRETEAQLNNKVKQTQKNAMAEFRFTVRKIISKIGEEKGLDLILSEGVEYAKKKYDLTDEVLKRLKKQAEPKK